MILLMFAGMLRESEAVALRKSDVWIERVEDKEIVSVFVRKSKTDQLQVGNTRVLASNADPRLCPVKWVRLLQEVAPAEADAFFWKTGGGHLASTSPSHILRKALERIGVDPAPYGSHSLRKGGATAAAAAGVEERLIKWHGNWKSDCVHLYIQESLEKQLAVSEKMLDMS